MRFFFFNSHAHRILDPEETRVSGGAELQVALLAKELSCSGHEVTLVGSDTGQPPRRNLDKVDARTAGKFHSGGALDSLGALPRVMSLLRECRPDYVVVLGWTAWLEVLLWLRPFFGYRLIYICGLDPEIDGSFGQTHGWRGKMFERGVRGADGRFAMSLRQEELFQQSKQDSAFYRNLILPRRTARTAAKDIDLFWVARCQPIKRPHLFLDLVESIPEASCTMVCPRENEALWLSVEKRAATLPNLMFHESIPYHEIQDVYDRAKFVVSTSEAEGFPNNMIQGAQGSAGVISLVVDPDGFIERFDAGFCAAGDFECLVKETRRLVSDETATEIAGQGAERMAKEWLDNASNMEKFLQGLPR